MVVTFDLARLPWRTAYDILLWCAEQEFIESIPNPWGIPLEIDIPEKYVTLLVLKFGVGVCSID